MKGDFSRDPEYRAQGGDLILQQQGRVQLDSDWNHLATSLSANTSALTRALQGAHGARRREAGFELFPRGGLRFSGDESAWLDLEAREHARAFRCLDEGDMTLHVLFRALRPGTLVHARRRRRSRELVLSVLATGEICLELGDRRWTSPLPQGDHVFHAAVVLRTSRVERVLRTEVRLYVDGTLAKKGYLRMRSLSGRPPATTRPAVNWLEERVNAVPEVSGAGAALVRGQGSSPNRPRSRTLEDEELQADISGAVPLVSAVSGEAPPSNGALPVPDVGDDGGVESVLPSGPDSEDEDAHVGDTSDQVDGPPGVLLGARLGEKDAVVQDPLQGLIVGVQLRAQAQGRAAVWTELAWWLYGADDAGLVGHWPLTEGVGDLTHDRHERAPAFDLRGPGCAATPPRWPRLHLCATPGVYTVHGRLCVNEMAGVVTGPIEGRVNERLAWIEVWPRLLTFAEVPSLREVALDGPDTSALRRWAWRVRVFDGDLEGWRATQRGSPRVALAAWRDPTQVEELDNDLYRVEVHCTGSFFRYPRAPEDQRDPSGPWSVRPAVDGGTTINLEEGFKDYHALPVGQLIELYTFAVATEQPLSHLAIVAQRDLKGATIGISPPLPDEMQELGALSLRPLMGFKWSRENGSAVFQIGSVDRTDSRRVVLQGAGAYVGELPLQGDAVEYVREEDVLEGRPGMTWWVDEVDPDTNSLTVVGRYGVPSPAEPPSRVARVARVRTLKTCDVPPFFRRWNASTSIGWTRRGIAPVQEDAALVLERGVTIEFDIEEGSELRVGDYWQIPARTITRSVLWPTANGVPLAQEPFGPERVGAPLALLHVRGEGQALGIEDLRRWPKIRRVTFRTTRVPWVTWTGEPHARVSHERVEPREPVVPENQPEETDAAFRATAPLDIAAEQADGAAADADLQDSDSTEDQS